MESGANYLDLADYRRSVAEMYARARRPDLPVETRWERFRRERDGLFQTHPQSALTGEQKKTFQGLPYYAYDPTLRYLLPVDPDVGADIWEVELPDEGSMRLKRFGKIHFMVQAHAVTLTLFWISAYGGGIFLPFRDQTNSKEIYGGGRYLLDTIKGADLGREGDEIVIDFNFAYNPSCAYHFRWVCPLAPSENWLPAPIRAGEWAYPESAAEPGRDL